ncbi:peroxidase 64 [Cucumis melo var. makuwa]|uniref:Peroxidase 64 n=1 Tax=Cucumis melo var. makuwa TaxID=1194695 RepID=A0A5D3BUF0_CUCMM|nr:peroxidase 64 [Cucumis melo var. makuwa]
MTKSWYTDDQGFLIECRSMEGSLTMEELYDEEPEELPPKTDVGYHIHLKKGTNPVNVRPYRYAHQQKEEMEKFVDEMLTSGVIPPSNNPYSSPVLLVKKKDGN